MTIDEGAIDRQAVTMAVNGLLAGDHSSTDAFFFSRGCTPPQIQIDPPADDIDGEQIIFLHEYWNQISTPSEIPRTDAIDPLDMVPVLGYIALVDVLEDGWRFRYRLFGSSLVQIFGHDMTGRYVSELPGPVDVAYFFTAVYRAALILKRPIVTAHVPAPDVGAQSWRRVVLPLADDAGAVTRFLVGNTPIGWRAAERGFADYPGSLA